MTIRLAGPIKVRYILDDNPDLSYLEQDYKSDGLTESQRQKYLAQDKQRLKNYYDGNWSAIGIKAEAQIQILNNPSSWILQTIHSGGLWGIESDSTKSYLEEVEQEEISELKHILRKLNVQISKDHPIEVIKE